MTPSKSARRAPAVLALVLSGCPIYDHAECTLNRAGCPEGTSCDLRTGLCVHLLRREDAGGSTGPRVPGADDAGTRNQTRDLDASFDAGPARDGGLDAGP